MQEIGCGERILTSDLQVIHLIRVAIAGLAAEKGSRFASMSASVCQGCHFSVQDDRPMKRPNWLAL